MTLELLQIKSALILRSWSFLFEECELRSSSCYEVANDGTKNANQ